MTFRALYRYFRFCGVPWHIAVRRAFELRKR